MNWKDFGKAGLCLGSMMLVAAGGAFAQSPAASKSTNPAIDVSHRTAAMLRSIRDDAAQIQSAAARLDELTNSSQATWVEYDRQWNKMKPAEEDMLIRLARLEKMQANLTPALQTEVNQSKAMIQQIQARTHELRVLLDKNGVQTNDAHFKIYATRLKRDSNKLERTVSAS